MGQTPISPQIHLPAAVVRPTQRPLTGRQRRASTTGQAHADRVAWGKKYGALNKANWKITKIREGLE